MGKVICPSCGHSHTIENDGDEDIEHLYYCNYCNLWFIYLPLSWQLPQNPEIARARARWKELGLVHKKGEQEE